MEALTRLVSESFARHGFDRPIDYRRLKWSRWFRCESHHSLLFVPSKPGVFALAEEMESGTGRGAVSVAPLDGQNTTAALAAEARRTLAVTQFFEADDMAFILDRMLSRYNPMRARLESGRYFIRFVVIDDESQRRNIHAALNQWIHASAEKTNEIGSHFVSSLEPAPEHVSPADDSQANLFSSAEMGRVIFSAHIDGYTQARVGIAAKPASSEEKGAGTVTALDMKQSTPPVVAPRPSGADTKVQSPPAFPSGF